MLHVFYGKQITTHGLTLVLEQNCDSVYKIRLLSSLVVMLELLLVMTAVLTVTDLLINILI
jgi:hypothetical protein